jgi:hypothetical protein
MNVRIAAVLTLCVSAAAGPAHAQDSALQYRWKQGDVLVYRTSLKTTSKVTGVPGRGDVALDQTMSQRIRLLAAAVGADGSVTLHQTTEAVSVEMETPMGKVGYDSADPKSMESEEARTLGQVFGGIVGTTISITMSSNGSIQRIDGVQKVLDKIMRDLPPEQSSSPVARGLRSVLSEPAVRASLEQSFPRLPPQPVKPGDSWNGQISLGAAAVGKVTGTQTLTVKSIDGGVAIIDVAVTLKQESNPPLGPSGMTVTLGDARGEGQITFDVAAGRIRKSTMSTELPSTMTAVAQDGSRSTIRSESKSSMSMELQEK